MVNMFSKCVGRYKDRQGEIRKIFTDGDKGRRITRSLLLPGASKKALKLMTVERNTIIMATIHRWVVEYCEKVNN